MGIVLRNVIKRYNKENKMENRVLNGLSLRIEDGEMVALKGKSGAGKSTLLHIVGLVDTMSEGYYELDDIDVSSMSNSELAVLRNEKIGFVLQDFGLVEEESVLYNVSLPMIFGNTPMKQIKKKALYKLKEIGIGHLANRKVAVLSGGEKQRVAIARALVNNPQYILADEPTGALDIQTSIEILDILCELNKHGKTIILVTHDEKVANVCERVLIMEDGIIVENQQSQTKVGS